MSETDKRTQPGGLRALVLSGGWGEASYSLALTFYKVMRMPTPPYPAALHNRLHWGCLSEMDGSEAGREGGREN